MPYPMDPEDIKKAVESDAAVHAYFAKYSENSLSYALVRNIYDFFRRGNKSIPAAFSMTHRAMGNLYMQRGTEYVSHPAITNYPEASTAKDGNPPDVFNELLSLPTLPHDITLPPLTKSSPSTPTHGDGEMDAPGNGASENGKMDTPDSTISQSESVQPNIIEPGSAETVIPVQNNSRDSAYVIRTLAHELDRRAVLIALLQESVTSPECVQFLSLPALAQHRYIASLAAHGRKIIQQPGYRTYLDEVVEFFPEGGIGEASGDMDGDSIGERVSLANARDITLLARFSSIVTKRDPSSDLRA